MRHVAINTRALLAPTSGVQRYGHELVARLPAAWTRLRPSGRSTGIAGHAWEQVALPRLAGDAVLFSPANVGPLAHARQVVTIHDLSPFEHPEAFSGAFGQWYRLLQPRLARRVAAVITVSEFSRGRIVALLGVAPSRVHVVPPGVTPPPAAVDPATQAMILRRLGVRTPFVLFVGSDDPRKNGRRLVEGFVRAAVPGLALVLAGGANPRVFGRSGVTAATTGHGVHHVGHVTDAELAALYGAATGLVFPSVYEGFGLPPLEAMAHGCPVACAHATSIPEVCGPGVDAGGAVLYFDPRSTDAIAQAIVALHALPAERRTLMVDRGRRRAADFSWDRCAAETRRIVEAIATR